MRLPDCFYKISICFALLFTISASVFANDSHVFLLIEKDGELKVEKVDIPDQEEIEITRDGLVTLVYSLGEGKSGDYIQKARRSGHYKVRNNSGQLTIRVNKQGNWTELPAMDTRSLRDTSIRVNATGAKTKKAFRIHQYSRIESDSGPVLDMFGGKLPLGEGDYAITFETTKPESLQAVTGVFNGRLAGGFLLVPVINADGKEGKFVVDLAASTSVVERDFVPKNVSVNKLESVAYSGNGEVRRGATMKGATGDVDSGFLGKAILPKIRMGQVQFDQLESNVMKEFPAELKQLGIVGILGVDALSRAGHIRFEKQADDEISIRLSEKDSIQSKDAINITSAGGLWFAKGKLGATPCRFLLDTGARHSILKRSFAKKNNVKMLFAGPQIEISGLGGTKMKLDLVRLGSITIGNTEQRDWNLLAGDIAVFDAMGIDDLGLILGMDFFSGFEEIEIDFKNRKMLLSRE